MSARYGAFGALWLVVAALGVAPNTACLSSSMAVNAADAGADAAPAPVVEGTDPSTNTENADAPSVRYRAIDGHPGCTTAGLSYPPASIPGYRCAAKAYPDTAEDKTKPIVLLVHGNSSSPADYEAFAANGQPGAAMLAEKLTAAGHRVFAVDFRKDKSDDPMGNNDTENVAMNFDHGWAVPIAEHFIESVLGAYPDRKISIVGFSVGPTIVRDALRRLHRAKKKPFERIQTLALAAGSHHGVSTYRKLCGADPSKPTNPTMRGRVACELGDRTAYTPTDFLRGLNGPAGAFETPCADGDKAYGQSGVCGGNRVKYLTIVMKDVKEGTFQDEFVSEGSSRLNGADNRTVELTDNDESGFFFNGAFKNHYGAIRSAAALRILSEALGQ